MYSDRRAPPRIEIWRNFGKTVYNCRSKCVYQINGEERVIAHRHNPTTVFRQAGHYHCDIGKCDSGRLVQPASNSATISDEQGFGDHNSSIYIHTAGQADHPAGSGFSRNFPIEVANLNPYPHIDAGTGHTHGSVRGNVTVHRRSI